MLGKKLRGTVVELRTVIAQTGKLPSAITACAKGLRTTKYFHYCRVNYGCF
ncbi:hypothetical protein [Polaribacter ponticola]|uniref:Uncharacterized protein n=1 Tax=Polaribacter ponticola TaxID=2978475 RepID=A0ABT5SAG5_9FLAO|nr:hypothetical protein [Polaribacter sp. MSW5]MDD7914476.1 hypothetical protein [Polaribacter sp. MSW5]